MTKINLAAAVLALIIALSFIPQAQAKSETTLRQQGRGPVVSVQKSDPTPVTPVKTLAVRISTVPSRNSTVVSRSMVWTNAQRWAKNPTAQRITWCESRHTPTAVNGTGKYRGAWQMDLPFWRSYGGTQFARTPDKASLATQNYVAFRGYTKRGYSPWRGSCSGIR